jgi:hypothetical protein
MRWQHPNGEYLIAEGAGQRYLREVLGFFSGQWTVMVGDSTMRMLYYHMVALLFGQWQARLGS